MTRLCPHCASVLMPRGNHFECGFCGYVPKRRQPDEPITRKMRHHDGRPRDGCHILPIFYDEDE